MQTPPQQSNGYHPEQPSSAGWASANPLPGVSASASAQSQNGLPSPASRPRGSGLLSNWKAGAYRGDSAHPGGSSSAGTTPLADQETLKQQAILKPVTEYPSARSNGNGTVSIHEQPAPYRQVSTAQPMMFVSQPPVQSSAQSDHPGNPGMAGLQQEAPFYLRAGGPTRVPMPGAAPAQANWNRSMAPSVYPPVQRREQGPQGRGQHGRTRDKRPIPVWARAVLILMLVMLVGGGSVAGYYFYTFSAPVNGIINQQVPRLKGDDDPNQGRGTGGSILSGGRINILLLGSDTDQKFNGTYLAQTDIVVTIDPATRSVAMLSIPRDFWINVPGSGMHKLDEAYALGGVALSRLTIFQDFGISINYYAWVGLDGFVKVIDVVKGVDVDVIHPITDDSYPDDVGNNTSDIYRYRRLYIPPGPQHLNGTDALQYVRSRHADLVGDFGRSTRQQQVLKQLKTKLNNPNIIGDLPQLANDLNGYVKTDMHLNDVFDLMRFARTIDLGKIKQVTLGPPYSSTGNTPDGKSVVFPNCSLIVPVITQLFGSTANARCNISANSNSNTGSLASSSQSLASNALVQTASSNALETASQMVSISTMKLNGGNNSWLGLHSLLDLLFLVVFESPDAMQV